jgi:ABC-2 type transport system permease protein
LRSREGALLRLEAGELASSRSAWLYLAAMGPLVGHAFSTAVVAYAEASGAGGGPAALPQALSPLDGILVPALGADDLALTLLYPFVAIRLISEEKTSGAGRLAAQSPAGLAARLGAKLAAAVGLWLLAIVPALLAVGLWRGYGGHLYAPELATLLLGHFLRFLLATSVAFAAAAVADGAASAAIVALGFTVGTWALDFVGTGRGGFLGAAARYTPAAALRTFERGELSRATTGVLVAATLTLFAVAREWLVPWRTIAAKAVRSAAILAAGAVVGAALAQVRGGRDLSEDRRNSFSRADEAALARIEQPVTITVRLAPEDPRLFDLERGVLSKLRRVVPHLTVRYDAASSAPSGLFAAPGSGYGENEYRVGSRAATSKSTTAPIVLGEIYRLAGVPAPVSTDESYPGYPLRAVPPRRWASFVFYAGWPLAVGLALVLERRGRWRLE